MAFKGGFLVKPTTTSTDALAGLYLNGVKAIADKKREIQKEELGILKEATEATNVPVTGVSTIDSLMGQYGVSKRNSIQELYEARQRGEISTDQYTMGMVNHTSETKLFSRLPEFIAKENAEIQKGIEEGKLSGINADLNIGRFRDLNGGNPEAENQVLTPYHINGQGFIKLGYTVNGEPRSQDISITKLMDPNKKRIQRFDLDDYTKKFKDGLEQIDYLTVREVERNGVKYIEKTVDASKSFETKQSVNRNVAYLDDDAMIDILYQKLGARLDYSSDYKEYTEEDVENRFGYRRDRFSIDLNERGIEIRPEHLSFKVENNKIKLTPEQEDIARGIVRAELYDTLGVKKTAEIIKEEKPKEPTKEDKMKELPLTSFYANTYDLKRTAIDQINQERLFKGDPASASEDIIDGEILNAINVSGDNMAGIQIPFELQEKIADITPNSFNNQRINRSTQIVVTKSFVQGPLTTAAPQTRYNIILAGPAYVGKQTETRTKEQAQSADSDKRTLEKLYEVDLALTKPLEEAQASTLYQYLYNNNNSFKTTADNKKYFDKGARGEGVKSGENFQQGLYEILTILSSK